MFHLLSHTEGSGGSSLLVDGFACAAQLRQQAPAAYDILAKTPVPWHASGNEGIAITPAGKFPVFNLDTETGELMQLRWNNDDRATMGIEPAPGVTYDDWFEAARLWNEIIAHKKNEFWEQLVPGRPLSMYLFLPAPGILWCLWKARLLTEVVFDNWRVMHARSSFTGKRRMAGGYSTLSSACSSH
jgi:trimethyllysine dioxygenase